MNKIPTLFQRDPENRKHVLPRLTSGCEWVLAGEGVATRKWDGTCVMLDEAGDWWARREVKPGKVVPENYVVVSHDEVTGKTMGWEPMAQSSFAKLHAEADWSLAFNAGTYELVGPKINGNPDGVDRHVLIPHGWASVEGRDETAAAPRDFEDLRHWMHDRPHWEGLVWHHPDGRMAKLKARDFPRT